MKDLRIYYSGSAYFDTYCSRWDQEDYALVIEMHLTKEERDKLRNNIRPGAVAELYRLLGRPVYYDTSFGSNTIRVEPIAGSQLAKMYSAKTIYVKNYSEKITRANTFLVKITGYISGSTV